jgi:hypothetical protein
MFRIEETSYLETEIYDSNDDNSWEEIYTIMRVELPA